MYLFLSIYSIYVGLQNKHVMQHYFVMNLTVKNVHLIIDHFYIIHFMTMIIICCSPPFFSSKFILLLLLLVTVGFVLFRKNVDLILFAVFIFAHWLCICICNEKSMKKLNNNKKRAGIG